MKYLNDSVGSSISRHINHVADDGHMIIMIVSSVSFDMVELIRS